MKRAWIIRALLLIIGVLIVFALIGVYRRTDIDQVTEAFGHLSWWHGLVFLGLLALRQLLNALPLAIYIPKISYGHALKNDLAASTASAFTPPPSDMVLRVAMFKSRGVAVAPALAATTMNSLTFFIVRFGIPIFGLALLPFTHQPLGVRALDFLSFLVCAAIVASVFLIKHSERQAAKFGHWLGRIIRKVRRSVDPDGWAVAFTEFQRGIASDFSSRFPRAIICTISMVITDMLILVSAIRFVGIPGSTLPIVVVASAFLVAFPLTLFPMQGAGVMDTAVLLSLVGFAGDGVKEPVLAALLIWRFITIIGPFILGAGAIVIWRVEAKRQTGESRP